MRKNKFFEEIIFFLSYLYPLKLIDFFKIVNRYLFSAKIKRHLQECGDNFKLSYPANIKGAKMALEVF